MKLRTVCIVIGCLLLVSSVFAQNASSPASVQVPPPLIQFSNVATDEGGNTLSGVVPRCLRRRAPDSGGSRKAAAGARTIPASRTIWRARRTGDRLPRAACADAR